MRLLALALVAACAALFGADPAALVRQVADYDYGKDPTAVRELESLVLRSAGGSDAAIERLLVAGLASARTLAAKDAFCRDLALLGGDAAVPSLEALLAAPETAEMARYALERIPGERSAAALRQALGRTSGAVKIGIVNSLGRRRDGASVDALKALLVSSDASLAGAAAEALGRIGDRAASQALLEAPLSLANAHALLRIAEQPGTDQSAIYRRLASDGPGDAVRAAALQGLARTDPAMALPLLRTALRSGAARLEAVAARELARMEGVALAKDMAGLAERAQVRIVAALADSGGVDVRPVLLEAASGASEAVRAAAISGLAKVGTAADIPLLATRAATAAGEEQAAARAALAGLRADGANAAILQLLPRAEPKVKLELIRAMGGRGITSGSEALLAAAADADREVRVESIRALRETAGTAQVPALVALLVKASNETERRECERTLAAVIRRSPEAPVAAVIEAYRAANASAGAGFPVERAVRRRQLRGAGSGAPGAPGSGRRRPTRRAECAGELAHARSARRPAGPGTLHRRCDTPGAGAARLHQVGAASFRPHPGRDCGAAGHGHGGGHPRGGKEVRAGGAPARGVPGIVGRGTPVAERSS